jgi:hypothetical protein
MTGQSRCSSCDNKAPADGSYAQWTAPSLDKANCPIQCKPGFGWNGTYCLLCKPGKYAPGGLPAAATVPADCVSCSAIAKSNAYWLEPVLFNGSWNGCPWDCNSGYYKDAASGNCVQCEKDTYTSNATIRVYDSGTPNQCLPCATCLLSNSFEAAACIPNRNRVCSACTISCQPGYYLTPCTLTNNSVCLKCASCSQNQYMLSTCKGQVSLVSISLWTRCG